jgi:hypothetical protein
VCVCVCVCVYVPHSCQLDCSPISTPPHVPRAPRTRRHFARTRLLTTSKTPSRNAAAIYRSPPRPVICQTYTLTCPIPRSHDDDYDDDDYQAATLQAARAPPVPQQRGRLRHHDAPRNLSKHPSNTRQRSQSSKARQRTVCVQADVRRQNHPTHAANTGQRIVAVPVVVPRAPTRRPPTQAANAAIRRINHHHNKRRMTTTTPMTADGQRAVCVYLCVWASQLPVGLLTHQHIPSRAPSAAHTKTRRTHSPPHNKQDPMAERSRDTTCGSFHAQQLAHAQMPNTCSHDDDNKYDYYQAAAPPSARAPPVPQQRGRRNLHEAPCNLSKHPSTHALRPSGRPPRNRQTHAANTRSAGPVVVHHAPTRRPPTQVAKAAISKNQSPPQQAPQ